MNITFSIKDSIIKYIQKSIPSGLDIVEQSIPICFFGNIETAKVATIGINPAPDAFSSNPTLLERSTLNTDDKDFLSFENATKVYNSLITYFEHPEGIHSFFKKLEAFISPVFCCHYIDGDMVHLDIVPWATNKKWVKIPQNMKVAFIEEYKNFFVKIIIECDIKTFFVNGKSVKNQLRDVLNLSWTDIKIKTGKNNTTISIAKFNDITFLALSRFIPNDFLSEQNRILVQNAIKDLLGKPINNIEKSTFVIKDNSMEVEKKNRTNRDYRKIFVGDNFKPFPKNRSVLEVIRIYCAKNSGISYFVLKEIFPDSLQVQRYGVVRLLEEIPDYYKKRYFVNPEELIHLNSGEVVAVCNQWGSGINYEKFFNHANKMGIILRYK